eukprot:scaffold38638_cov66-Phaeocystis_antarctica.AAC.3
MSACHTASSATLAAKLPASVLKSSTASASSMAWREQGEAPRLSWGRVGRSRLEFDAARWLASGMRTSQARCPLLLRYWSGGTRGQRTHLAVV